MSIAQPLVWIDLEMTGLDPDTDVLVEIDAPGFRVARHFMLTPGGEHGMDGPPGAAGATGGGAPGHALGVPAGVVVARQLVELLRVVDQLAELEHEHAGPLPVGHQHPDGLVVAQHRLDLVLYRAGGEIEILHPEPSQHPRDQCFGRGIERAGMDDGIARLDHRQEQRGDRRHAAGKDQRVLRLFPHAAAILENPLIRPPQTRIDHPLAPTQGHHPAHQRSAQPLGRGVDAVDEVVAGDLGRQPRPEGLVDLVGVEHNRDIHLH